MQNQYFFKHCGVNASTHKKYLKTFNNNVHITFGSGNTFMLIPKIEKSSTKSVRC